MGKPYGYSLLDAYCQGIWRWRQIAAGNNESQQEPNFKAYCPVDRNSPLPTCMSIVRYFWGLHIMLLQPFGASLLHAFHSTLTSKRAPLLYTNFVPTGWHQGVPGRA